MKIINTYITLTSIIFLAITPVTIRSEKNSMPDHKVLVVCYSRTGNTAMMAKKISNHFKAELVFITAPEYSNDSMGQWRAGRDAWNEKTTANITPATIDIHKYKLIFLGSPIWWYRPAVPLWAFVGNNDFKHKPVVLFNTFNSRFKTESIKKFNQSLLRQNAKLIDHVYIKRGRSYNQIDSQEFLKEIDALITSRTTKWNKIRTP